MLDVGWSELLVIAIVLIVVVGPKDLPPMIRAFGKMTANLRKMAGEFRTQFDEALKEAELDEVRKTISDAQKLNPTNALRDAINPLRQMGNEIKADLQKATSIDSKEAAAKPAETPVVVPPPPMTLPAEAPVVPAPAESVPATAAAAVVADKAPAAKPKRAAKATGTAKAAGETKAAATTAKTASAAKAPAAPKVSASKAKAAPAAKAASSKSAAADSSPAAEKPTPARKAPVRKKKDDA